MASASSEVTKGAKSPVKSTWDPFQTLDVSPSELKALQERQARRLDLKAEYQKLVTDPHGGGRGGYVFDPQIQRVMSARATGYQFFKPTPRSTSTLMTMLIIPFGLMFYFVHTDKAKQEARYRRGEVPVRERMWKFI